MAWSDSLARAWLATVWLVGTVEVSCGRHSSRLDSERVWLGRVYQGLIARFWWCCRKPRQGTTSLLPVGLRRADKGLLGPRLLGVIAAGSGVGGVKKCSSTVAWVGLRLSPLLGLSDYGLVGHARKGLAGHRVAGGYGGGVLRPSLVATGL